MRSGASDVWLEANLPHEPWICDWDRKPLAGRSSIGIGELRRYLAVADGRGDLVAQLRDRDKHRVPQAEVRWTFDGELPLNTIRDDLAALLRPLGDIDACIELQPNGSNETSWYVREFAARLDAEPWGLVPTPAVAEDGVRIVGRALHQPTEECDLGEYGLAAATNSRLIALSPLNGCWLIYLSAAGRVLTRPHWHQMPMTGLPRGALGEAMSIADHLRRKVALDELCDAAEGDGARSGGVLRDIVALAANLGGLPASTFDILQLVAKRPLIAVRLLFEASEQELPAVLALESALPFSWTLIAMHYWERAAMLRFNALLAALPETIPARVELAVGAITNTRKKIAEYDPSLAYTLGQPGPEKTLDVVAQAFMNRAHDRAEGFGNSPFRPHFNAILPRWIFTEGFWRALDAPCAAARAAREEIALDAAQVRCVKDVARRHPRYFAEAYRAVLKEQRR